MGERVAYNPTDSGVVHSHPFFIVMQSRIISPVPSSSRTEIRHFNAICKTVILKHQYIDQGKITHIAKVFFFFFTKVLTRRFPSWQACLTIFQWVLFYKTWFSGAITFHKLSLYIMNVETVPEGFVLLFMTMDSYGFGRQGH